MSGLLILSFGEVFCVLVFVYLWFCLFVLGLVLFFIVVVEFFCWLGFFGFVCLGVFLLS